MSSETPKHDGPRVKVFNKDPPEEKSKSESQPVTETQSQSQDQAPAQMQPMRQSKQNLSSFLINQRQNSFGQKALLQPIFSNQNLEHQKLHGVPQHGIAGVGLTAARKTQQEAIVLNQSESRALQKSMGYNQVQEKTMPDVKTSKSQLSIHSQNMDG